MLIQPCEAVLKLVDKRTLGCDIPPNPLQRNGHSRSGQHYYYLLSIPVIQPNVLSQVLPSVLRNSRARENDS